MLPPFDFAGGLVTEPFAFEKEISSDESLTLSDVRALSSKRRTLCAFRGVASDPRDAEARSAAADEYVPHLEALVAQIEQFDVTADRQKRFGFVWNSPLEGLGNTFKLTDIKHEVGMSWMLRAAALSSELRMPRRYARHGTMCAQACSLRRIQSLNSTLAARGPWRTFASRKRATSESSVLCAPRAAPALAALGLRPAVRHFAAAVATRRQAAGTADGLEVGAARPTLTRSRRPRACR